VFEGALEGRDWIAGEFSIADIALAPWLGALDFYGARDLVGWTDLKNAPAYLDRFLERPAVQRGRNVPPSGGLITGSDRTAGMPGSPGRSTRQNAVSV
jgi:GST-like protein